MRISVKRRRQRRPVKFSLAVVEAMALIDQERTADVVEQFSDREEPERETSETETGA